MKSPKSIQFKAAFLLTVFALNTLVSFACSVGLDMGFNSNHHAGENNKKPHAHSKKHSHGSDAHSKSHKHSTDRAGVNNEKSPEKDNCCKDKAVELQKADKSLNHSGSPVVKVPVLLALIVAFSGLEVRAELSTLLYKSFIPQYYPPPDKRIIIQSFQI
jgi:hypothetical protein